MKDDDGAIDAMELSDIPELGPLQTIEASSQSFWPRTTWSISPRRWIRAAPPASSSTRTSGPRRSRRLHVIRRQLIANGRIPIQAIIAAIEADAELETAGG